MGRKSLVILTLLFVCCLITSLPAVPLWYGDDPEANYPFGRAQSNSRTAETPQAASSAALSQQSGDTAYFICTDMAFTSTDGGGTDCWGWVDPSGTQYAIYGGWHSVEFYNTTTGEFVDEVDAPSCGWRDMKSYQNFCYSVSECSGVNEGIMIIDMQYLPDSVHYVGSVNTCNGGCVTSHNIWVDSIAGYLYVEGSSGSGDAVRIYDLSNPAAPAYVNNMGIGGGIHDFYAMNDTLYVAEGNNNTFSIWDIANKFNPQLLTRVTIPLSGYVHNIWPTPDGNYIVTTEETANKTVKVWDISDLNNVQLLSEYLGPSGLAHNAQMRGDTIYISHYESGVSIVDITDKNNPVELAVYDTYGASDNSNFNGCWGVYQYTNNGQIFASNMEGSLFVLSENQVILDGSYTVGDVITDVGQSVAIDIFASFNVNTHSFTIPLNYGFGPLNIKYDSFSTAGLMTDYFEVQTESAYDGFNGQVALSLKSTVSGTPNPLPPGSGIVARAYFTILSGNPGDSNPISMNTFSSKEANIAHPCLAFLADTTHGSLALDATPSCCVGQRGNVNNDPIEPPSTSLDISDLLYLVDFFFAAPAGPAPVCNEEADVNGSGLLDISDLLYLVDFFFAAPAGPAPLNCD